MGEDDGDVGEDDDGVGEDRGDDDGPRQRSGATGSIHIESYICSSIEL